MELTTTQKGALAEAEIEAAAIRLGIVPLIPRTEGRRYDVVFDLGGRLLRVQCKWASLRDGAVVAPIRTSRHTPGGYVATTYSAEEVDAVALYCDALDQVYLLPIGLVAGRGMIHLRVEPP